MKCKICGSELPPGATVCQVCGVAVDNNDYINNSFVTGEMANNNFNSQNNIFFQGGKVETPVNNTNYNSTYFQNMNTNNNLNNQNNEVSQSKKSKVNVIQIIIVFCTIAILVGGGFFLSKMIFTEEKPHNDNNNEEIIFDNNKDDDETTNPEGNQDEPIPGEPNNQDIYTSFYGYKFKLPDNYVPTIEEEYMTLLSQTDQTQTVLAIYPTYPYQTYYEEAEEVKRQWEERGYVINNYEEKNYGTSKWLVFDCSYNDARLNIAYRPFFGENNTIELIIINYGTISNEEIFNKLEKMLEDTIAEDKTAVEVSPSVDATINTNIGKI